jgi:hypothetical protein
VDCKNGNDLLLFQKPYVLDHHSRLITADCFLWFAESVEYTLLDQGLIRI